MSSVERLGAAMASPPRLAIKARLHQLGHRIPRECKALGKNTQR